MKVLEITDAYEPTVDGVVKVVQNYANAVQKVGECAIGAPSFPKKSGYKEKKGVRVIRCRSVKAPEGYRSAVPLIDGKFKKTLKNEKYDLIHTHAPFLLGRCAYRIAKKQNIPLVATLHTQYHRDFERLFGKKSPIVKFMLHFIVKTYKRADSVWTVSNASVKYLRQYGYNGDVTVIRNATTFVYPENAAELIDGVNKEYGLSGQKNVYIFVGRMAMYKNIGLIANALKIVADSGVDFKMLWVGGGFDIEELKTMVKDLGISDKCIFTGNVSDPKKIQALYLRSDMLLFPSTFDMASVTQIEASAHKKPAVVVGGSCSAEQIIDGENGFIIEESAKSLADKLIELDKKPERVKEVGLTAYKTLYRDWDMVGKEVVEEYQKIIDAKKSQTKKR